MPTPEQLSEPVTLLEAAQHLRLADTQEQAETLPDADLIYIYISAARQSVENYINQKLSEMGEVPAALKAAMLLLIAHFYDNREEVTVGTINPKNPVASEYLMNPYRVYS